MKEHSMVQYIRIEFITILMAVYERYDMIHVIHVIHVIYNTVCLHTQEIEKGFLAASDEPRPSVLKYLENIAQTALLEAAEDGDCERLVSIMEGRSSQGYQGYGPGHGMESLPSRHTSNGSNASSGTKNRNQNPNLDAVELAISINAASSSSSSNSSSCKLSDTSGHSSAGGERGSDARKSERRMGGGKVSGTSGEAGLDLNEVELVRDSDWKNARVRGSMER